jgi:hypothetical protein
MSASFGQLEQEKYHRIMPLLGNPTSPTYSSSEYMNCPEIAGDIVAQACLREGCICCTPDCRGSKTEE